MLDRVGLRELNRMRQRTVIWTFALLISLSILACTDASLRGIPVEPTVRDDKLQISGTFCTEDPSTLLFPVRVLIMVDASESMIVTDPLDPVTGMPRRETAAREAVQELLGDEDRGVSIAVIRFSAEARVLTFADENGDGVHNDEEGFFTRSRTQLLGDGTPENEGVLEQLRETDRTSDFVNALAVAYATMRDEMERADDASLPLSKYVVIFLSDFLPDVEGEEARENSNERVLDSVDNLVELAQLFRVGELQMNFAYISTARDDVDREAEDLGRAMAVHGNGAFRSFPNNEELNFLFVDLSALRRVFTLDTMIAVNTSTVSRGIGSCGDGEDRHLVTCPEGFNRIEAATCCQPPEGSALPSWNLEERRMCCDRDHDGFESPWCGGGDCDDWDNQNFPGATRFLVDSDADGVPDEDENRILSDPQNADTDGDGFSDLLEYRFRTSGLDPLDPFDADCLAGEVALGTIQCNDGMDNDGDGEILDSDGDGIIDTRIRVDSDDSNCMSAFDDTEGEDGDAPDLPNCVDGEDNDGDGWVDAADPDCMDLLPGGESTDHASSCGDGADNDGDGLTDEADPSCRCDPNYDNDGDGIDDDEDPDCLDHRVEPGIGDADCNDGLDNDGDGLIDSEDEGCASALDDTEEGTAHPWCRDGEDNDLDGWIDGADPDCITQDHLRDSDGDMLGNCEERFFGTSRAGADTDADGIPDPVEIRFNVSAVNDDLLDDYDRDNTGNGDEVRRGTDPRYNDAGGRARNSYRYMIDELGITRRATEIGGYTLTACNDGHDNDGDGMIDSLDEDCRSPLQNTEEPITEPTCLDGEDNDGDGWIDLDDAGCLENLPETSIGTTSCNDGEDNNIDGLIDSLDPDCLTGFQSTEEPINEETCLDGEDNDMDGWTDELDPDCALNRRESGRGTTACNNGLDDDNDGTADAFDPDCLTGFQTTEEPIDAPSCDDGIDNDGDGWIDELDPSCGLGRPEYATALECNDGMDNDGDGHVDTDDPDCRVAIGGREARTAERNCSDGVDNDGDGWIDELDPECLTPGSRSCYEFSIDNVTLAQTLGNGWNRILIFAGEVPFDDPEAFPRYLVACVEARYVCSLDPELAELGECNDNFKEPPGGHYQVDPEQFVPLDEFDPRIHCQDAPQGL